jgi:integrase
MAKHPKHHLYASGTYWQYRRRVPRHLAEFDKRSFVKESTKVRVAHDPKGTHALKVALRIDHEIERYWSDLVQGRVSDARKNLKAAVKRAQLLGFVYHSHNEVRQLPLEERLERTDVLADKQDKGNLDDIDVTALLGGAAPAITLTQLVDTYEALDTVKLKIRNKNEHQKKIWRSVRDCAVQNLIEVVGNKDIKSLTRDDGKRFRAWWAEKIMADDLTTEGARKDVNALRVMIRDVCEDNELADLEPFHKIKFKGSGGSREPFAINFVRDVILKPGALDGIDDAVRDILLICIDTGARPSEVIFLPKADIHLRTNIPYIEIRDGGGREVKTNSAEREIPLVGVALEAMRRNPHGFPQFHRRVKYVETAINERLRDLQTDVNEKERALTFYSIRHCFKDRLRATSAREEMIDALFGHANKKPKYGRLDLAAKREIMDQLVFSRAPRLVA